MSLHLSTWCRWKWFQFGQVLFCLHSRKIKASLHLKFDWLEYNLSFGISSFQCHVSFREGIFRYCKFAPHDDHRHGIQPKSPHFRRKDGGFFSGLLRFYTPARDFFDGRNVREPSWEYYEKLRKTKRGRNYPYQLVTSEASNPKKIWVFFHTNVHLKICIFRN